MVGTVFKYLCQEVVFPTLRDLPQVRSGSIDKGGSVILVYTRGSQILFVQASTCALLTCGRESLPKVRRDRAYSRAYLGKCDSAKTDLLKHMERFKGFESDTIIIKYIGDSINSIK